MRPIQNAPIENIVKPIQKFFPQEKSGGLVLGFNVIIALFLANSSLKREYHHFFEQKFGFQFNGKFCLCTVSATVLMAIFFFMVALELKREIVVGELSACSSDWENCLSSTNIFCIESF